MYSFWKANAPKSRWRLMLMAGGGPEDAASAGHWHQAFRSDRMWHPTTSLRRMAVRRTPSIFSRSLPFDCIQMALALLVDLVNQLRQALLKELLKTWSD